MRRVPEGVSRPVPSRIEAKSNATQRWHGRLSTAKSPPVLRKPSGCVLPGWRGTRLENVRSHQEEAARYNAERQRVSIVSGAINHMDFPQSNVRAYPPASSGTSAPPPAHGVDLIPHSSGAADKAGAIRRLVIAEARLGVSVRPRMIGETISGAVFHVCFSCVW